MRENRWSKAGSEPALWEVLADPIVLSLMKADRLVRKDVLLAVAGDSDRLALTAKKVRLSA